MITIVASRMQELVFGWQMLEVTDSAFWVGLVVFAQGVPLLLWSPITGVLADRRQRQHIIVAALVLSALASGGLAAQVALGEVAPWQIILAAFLAGSAFTLYAPARLALLPNLVPDDMLLSASTVEYSSTRLMGFVGPMVGGALVDVIDISPTLLFQVILLVGAMVIFMGTGLRLSDAQRDTSGPSRWLASMNEAVDYLRQDRPLFALAVLGLVFVPFGMTFQKLMPVFAKNALGAGASTLGLLLGVSSLGTALSGYGVAAVGDTFRKGRALLLCSILFGSGMMLLALCRNIWMASILLFVLGLVSGVYLTLSNVLFQSRPPDALRGRVMSVWGMVWGILPFTSLVAGAVADTWSVTLAIGASGALCAVFSIGMALRRTRLWKL